MAKMLPVLPITQEHLLALVAALLIYQRYRREKTPLTEERTRTLLILECLIPKLYSGIDIQNSSLPLWLTVDDVQVIKMGLATLIDQLNRKPTSAAIARELQRMKKLKTVIEQTFKSTQD